MKRAALFVLVILFTLAATVVAWQIRSVILILVAAIFLGATMRPIPEFFTRFKLPTAVGAIVMLLVIFGSLILLLGVTGYALGEEAPKLLRALENRYASLQQEWRAATGWQQAIAANLPESFSTGDLIVALEGVVQESSMPTETPALENALEGEEAPVEDAAVEPLTEAAAAVEAATTEEERTNAALRLLIIATGGIAGLLGQFVILVFVSLYWTMERPWFERLWISLLPAHLRQQARTTWRNIERNVSTHIRSELLQSVVAGILVYVAARVLAIEYPVLLAWAVSLAWLIPLVGWMFALLFAIIVGLLSAPWVALVIPLFVLVVYAVLEFVVEPRLDVRRNAGSILGLLLAMIMLNILGVIGLLLASPLAVAINSALMGWSVATATRELTPESGRAALQEKLARLREAMATQEMTDEAQALPRRTRSLYDRLEDLVKASEEYLPATSEEKSTP